MLEQLKYQCREDVVNGIRRENMANGSMTRTANSGGAKPRVLVFVVAYEAEATLRPVLARIPDAVFDRCETEVLIIDDSSRDRTFEVGLRSAWASQHTITVLHNAVNQGYGGNQKLGYHYAIGTASTSSCCCTATASTRRNAFPTCSRRSSTARPMPCSARGC